ncbi:6-phospho-beta-glucosidase [Austwickia chelonae]|uniref:Putative glycoside hydrolase n=1 Tax=Austwickia chelonae NBRC 105200 TaxID=1184607 RepID=K6VPN5_9MICO|nr:6-phospho-beta-glucosidase [Austwickia chelonae]GAB78699.1 putative glycoside hydrolase [Austwickia chelonae NBRC 105200]SEW34818.1 6-phospho-beta-glucosidase [Austwickia chelonae]
MKLAILGGGGFRVPLVYRALLGDVRSPRVEEVALYDLDPARLAVIERVTAQMAAAPNPRRSAGCTPPRVVTTTDLDEALTDADFVFSAIRVGGLSGRTCDERVALRLGVLGQETVGPGGIAYGLRTIPVALAVAERVAAVAPRAWFINFTNPAGMITQAVQDILGDRVVGICDSPIALGRRAARALGVDGEVDLYFDYAGLNHLGWLQGVRVNGVDRLPELLADPERLLLVEEGRLFGPDWLASLGAIPNEYLYYYDYAREALAAARASAQTRGEFLLGQQQAFFAAAADDPPRALELWHHSHRERDETYMQEVRAEGAQRDRDDLAAGGYESVALAVMAAIARGEPSRMILGVRNGTALPGLPSGAVVELPCLVDGSGVRVEQPSPLTGRMIGLVQQVKAAEEATIRAVEHRSASMAVAAFAQHPLVDSVSTARLLLEGYRAAVPAVDQVFAARR